MYNHFTLAVKYLRYYITASNGKGHGMHSPFVYEFITKVLNDETSFEAYRRVEDLRKRLSNEKTLLAVDDMGAGSAVSNAMNRSIASIAKNAAKPAKFGQLLYRIVQYYQPAHILELGTSLGITTSYLSLANPGSTIVTMEGATAVADIAKANFKTLGLANISIREGNFDQTLSSVVSSLSSVDFAFIDGNHRLKPTIQYFEALMARTDNFSIIILDDIHWSDEMEQAWKYCQDHPAVTLSIDLFFIGILFFRKEIRGKRHFSIRF